jgi:hypothetical protein
MDKTEQFTALMRYIEEKPEVLAQHSGEGKALLEDIEEACLTRNAQDLGKSIDAFLSLLMGDQTMRGFTPTASEKAVEQFNSVHKATRSVLDKMQK